ncbi:hypothetical protein GCM10023176_59680 [Micromonospora coerulea]|uniref:Secreted protein n=1 Tax=Micromonospora coerulea TaxID=47856 RepID=A0ABP8T4G2_9ACTN|nr:hypothetical protein [Micromonospora veneta]
MTTVLVVLVVVAVLVVAMLGYVAWRDRGRRMAGDDPARVRDAEVRRHRYEAERHGSQGDLWQRGHQDSSP